MKCGYGIDECQWDPAVHRIEDLGLEYKFMKKTISELIDALITTNIKVFMLVDKVQKNEHTKEDAKKLQDLNSYRSQLSNAINEYFNERQEVKI